MTPPPENPRHLLPLILAITSTGVLAFSIISPVLPDLATELEVSRGAVGFLQGAVALPGIFLAAYIGYLADRHGRRRVVRVSLLVFGVFGVASFFAPNYAVLVVFRVLQGLGTSGLLSLGVVVIGDMFTGLERRWAMGLNLAALTATTTFAPIIGGVLAEGGTFRPFLVFVVAFPLFVWARKLPDPEGVGELPPPVTHLRQALQHLRGRGTLSDFLGVLPMSFLTLGVFLGLGMTVLPLFLENEFGLSSSQRGLVQSILSASSSTASVLSARIGARFAPNKVLTGSFLLMIVGFVLIGVAPSLWLLPVGLVVLGSGTGSIFPLLQDYSAAVGPARYRGALVGTWVSANRLGQTVGPAGGGALADGIGERSSYLVGAAVIGVVAAIWRPARSVARSRMRAS